MCQESKINQGCEGDAGVNIWESFHPLAKKNEQVDVVLIKFYFYVLCTPYH